MKDELLIPKFVEICEHSGKIIETILQNENLSINDKDYVELRDGLKWYQRFHDMGKMELIDKSQGTFFDLREISSSLKVHYKWLMKFFRRLFTLIDAKLCDSKTQEDLSDFSKKYLDSLIDVDKFGKIRKKVRQVLCIPSPHFSENSMAFHEKLRCISRKLEITEEDLIDSLKTKLKIITIGSPENLAFRKRFAEICVENFGNNRENANTISDIGEIEEMAKNIIEVKEINESDVRTNKNFVEAKIWPIYEFFFLFFAYRFQRKFCDEFAQDIEEEIRRSFEKNLNESNEISENLTDLEESRNFVETACGGFGRIYEESVFRKFEQVPTIPTRLISLMKALNANEMLTKRRISLFPQLLCSVEEFAERSFAVKNSNILLHWDDDEEDMTEDDFNISQVFFFLFNYLVILSYLIIV